VTPPFIPDDVAARRRAMTPEYNPIGSPPDLAALPSSGWGGGGPTHNIILNANSMPDDEDDLRRGIENSMQDAPPEGIPCSLSAGGAHSRENYRGASAAASAAASASVNLPARAAPRRRGNEETMGLSTRRRVSGKGKEAAAAGPRVQGNMAPGAQRRDAARKLREFRQAGASMETDQHEGREATGTSEVEDSEAAEKHKKDMASVQAELRRAQEKLHEAHQKLEQDKKQPEQASASKKSKKDQKKDSALEEKVQEAHQKLEEEKKSPEQASAPKKSKKDQKKEAALKEEVARLEDKIK